jgi:hypothetical protein
MMRTRFVGALAVVFLCVLYVPPVAGLATAQTRVLPSYVTLPPEVPAPNSDQVSYEVFGEAQFFPHDADTAVVQTGKHWHAGLSINGLADDASEKTVWSRVKPAFLQSGWTVSGEYDQNPFSSTLHFQKGGTDAWAYVVVFGAGDIRMDIVELGGQPMTFALDPPAAVPERVAPEPGDFPYLAPLPGSQFSSGRLDDGPLSITLPGSDEPQLVGTGVITKDYAAPPGLSNLQFATVYHDALVKGGWTVVGQSQHMNQSDASITAHYTKGTRDIWAVLHGLVPCRALRRPVRLQQGDPEAGFRVRPRARGRRAAEGHRAQGRNPGPHR